VILGVLNQKCQPAYSGATGHRPAQQLRQLRHVGGEAQRLVAGEQLGRRSPAGLILEIDVGERLLVRVPDDEAGVRFLDGPRRREAALADRRRIEPRLR
jgi:hypothetical protein